MLRISAQFLTALCLFSFFVAGNSTTFAHEGERVIVKITELGFSPREVTVPIGTEVIFENRGTEDHWPASDDHPRHTHYDGSDLREHCALGAAFSFDACAPLSPGATWSFTPYHVGNFAYHDHLWPVLTGNIIATNGPPPVRKTLISYFFDLPKRFYGFLAQLLGARDNLASSAASEREERYLKLEKKYETTIRTDGPEVAIEDLTAAYRMDEDIMPFCHDLLHHMGQVAFERYRNFEETIRFSTDLCDSGYVHGVIESYVLSVPDPLSDLPKQCDAYAKQGGRDFDRWECEHGVGHGFMYLSGGDLDHSLALCRSGFSGGAVTNCQNGIYMEVFNLEALAKEKEFLDTEDPLRTCREREAGKNECYLYLPYYLSATLAMSPEEMFDICTKAEFGYDRACMQGAGAVTVGRNLSEPEIVFSLCKSAGSAAYEELCIGGAAVGYMNQEGSYEAGLALCEKAPGNQRATCENAALAQKKFFGVSAQ